MAITTITLDFTIGTDIRNAVCTATDMASTIYNHYKTQDIEEVVVNFNGILLKVHRYSRIEDLVEMYSLRVQALQEPGTKFDPKDTIE